MCICNPTSTYVFVYISFQSIYIQNKTQKIQTDVHSIGTLVVILSFVFLICFPNFQR